MSGEHFSQRWSSLLDAVAPASARAVQRGRALARRGAVEDLTIAAGRITGRVRDDRLTAERVVIDWPVPSDAVWESATGALAAEVRFTAALLEGTVPEDSDELFAQLGVPLVPGWDDLDVRCTCAQRMTPCSHAAAVHVAAALRIDRTPTVLLELRGRGRDELLRAVRAERGAASPPTLTIDAPDGIEAARGDLDAIELHPAPVDDPAGLLEHLGEPPGVDDVEPLLRTVERAAAVAWRLAAGDGAQAADEELLLAELRAQRVATAHALAEALGRDTEAIAAQLDALFESGAVLRTGSGERTRYRAAV